MTKRGGTASARRLLVTTEEQMWPEVRPLAARRVLLAAAAAFAEQGYHNTTTRDIAERVGLSPAGVYVHFRSKEELLYRVSLTGHQQGLAVLERAAAAETDPVARVRAIVRDFASWHAVHHNLARAIQNELSALTPAHLAEVAEVRRRVSTVVRTAIEDGVAAGVFDPPDVPGAALAMLSLCIDVARWYAPTGPRRPADIGTLYADLALRMLRPCREP